MDELVLYNIKKEKKRVLFEYTSNGLWSKYLKDREMWIDYEFNVDEIPDNVLVIPFLANILPISWIFNLKIKVKEIDEAFYNSIEQIKNGYKTMYNDIKFAGFLGVSNVILNDYETDDAGLLFSGGVDAVSSLITNLNLEPDLVTIWGSDIKVDNESGWNIVKKFCKNYALKFNLKSIFLRSNFRDMLNYTNLNNDLKLMNPLYEWWHEMQHGISLICLGAPVAYFYKYKKLIIASSYTPNDRGLYYCASDPTIDEMVKFGSCDIKHDGYENSRVDKLKIITDYVDEKKIKLPLRVCWISDDGKNCCECEKCHRTMLALLSIKKDPRQYGFLYSEEQYIRMVKKYKDYMKYDVSKRHNNYVLYKCIQEGFVKNYDKTNLPKGLENIKKVKIHKNTPFYIIYLSKLKNEIKRIIERK